MCNCCRGPSSAWISFPGGGFVPAALQQRHLQGAAVPGRSGRAAGSACGLSRRGGCPAMGSVSPWDLSLRGICPAVGAVPPWDLCRLEVCPTVGSVLPCGLSRRRGCPAASLSSSQMPVRAPACWAAALRAGLLPHQRRGPRISFCSSA